MEGCAGSCEWRGCPSILTGCWRVALGLRGLARPRWRLGLVSLLAPLRGEGFPGLRMSGTGLGGLGVASNTKLAALSPAARMS